MKYVLHGVKGMHQGFYIQSKAYVCDHLSDALIFDSIYELNIFRNDDPVLYDSYIIKRIPDKELFKARLART